MKRVLAIILAGGRGKRMGILCRDRAKPVLPFAGKYRIIDFYLSNCVNSGIHDIAVLVDYQRSNLTDYLDNSGCQWTDGLRDLQILKPKSGSYRSTAEAMYQNIPFIEMCGADLILILTTDQVYRMDYNKMIDSHCEKKADITIGVIPVPIVDAHRFGVVTVDTNGRLMDFVEKPKIPQSNLVSMGIYIFNKNVLLDRLREDANKLFSPYDFGHAIIPDIVKKDNAYAYVFNGFWRYLGSIKAYYQANMEIISRLPYFITENNKPVLSREDGEVAPRISGEVRHSIISPGCVIKGKVEDSVLSPGVWIGEQAVIKRSVLMNNTFVGKHSVVNKCVLDECVSVKQFSYLGFGTSPLWEDWDITVVGRDAVIPAFTSVGRNCKVLPNVGPADFKTRVVPPDSIVARQQCNEQIKRRKFMVPVG